MLATYKTLPDLFIPGIELVLDEEQPLLIWLQKLNSAQYEEARRDGSVARARTMLALREAESEEMSVLRDQFKQLPDEAIRTAIVEMHGAEFLGKAQDRLRTDPEWLERIEILLRSDPETLAEDDPGLKVLSDLNRDYLEALLGIVTEFREELEHELESFEGEDLHERYFERYIEQRSNDAFMGIYRITEMFYAARSCHAARLETRTGQFEGWSHKECNHAIRVFDDKREIYNIDDALRQKIAVALDSVGMSPRDARFSARPGSSSESSPRPSVQEDSEPSIPVVVPGTPAGT